MGCSKIGLMGKAWRQVKAKVSAPRHFQQMGDFTVHTGMGEQTRHLEVHSTGL